MIKYLACFCCLLAHITLAAETINSVVASVDSQAITKQDMRKATATNATVSTNLLDQEIFYRLIKLEAARNRLSTNREEIEYYLKEIASNQGETVPEFYAKQQARGLSAKEVNQEMEIEILKQKLAHKLFQNSKHKLLSKKLKKAQTKVDLSQIIIDLDRHSFEDADKLANKIQQKYDDGEDFENLVEKYSNAVDLSNKGNLGTMPLTDLDSEFAKELERIDVEELTSPIKKGNYLFIFRLNDRQEPDQESEDEQESQDDNAELSPEQTNQLLTDYFQKELYQKYVINKK